MVDTEDVLLGGLGHRIVRMSPKRCDGEVKHDNDFVVTLTSRSGVLGKLIMWNEDLYGVPD